MKRSVEPAAAGSLCAGLERADRAKARHQCGYPAADGSERDIEAVSHGLVSCAVAKEPQQLTLDVGQAIRAVDLNLVVSGSVSLGREGLGHIDSLSVSGRQRPLHIPE